MNGRYIICKTRILDFRPRVLEREREKLKLEKERMCRVTKGRERGDQRKRGSRNFRNNVAKDRFV